MSKVLAMRKKRGEIWDKAKAFLDEHRGEDGLMSAEDTQAYERMEQEVVDLGHAVEREERAEALEREMNAPANTVYTSKPEQPVKPDNRPGRASTVYNEAFWKQMRDRSSYEVR
ncbi:MAG TPA: phage major capsid protein, partial [Candidatus Limiplasma sp.]|nr:phage major capsid protein [Candidatus Limiplasma sp.]